MAPKIFGLGVPTNRTELLKSIRRLRGQIVRKRQPIHLDFSMTEKIFADGMLLFVAELRRMIRLTQGGVSITTDVPSNGKIAQVLKQVGIFDLLGTRCDVEPVDDDVVNWRTAYGQAVEGAQYENVLGSYDGDITPALSEQLYTGITEAMANVVNHAYSQPRADGLDNSPADEWWMFSQERDGWLTVVICDLGAGIPATLPHKQPSLWQRILRKKRRGDAYVIQYAVQDSISRTGHSHRGRGLGQIARVVESIPGGEVGVHSNRGFFRRAGTRVTIQRYNDSVMGTLIFWKVPLQGKEVQ